MKKFLVTAAALALLAGPAIAQSGGGGGGVGGGGGAGAQGDSVNRSGTSPAMDTIDNTRRTAIREYITRERVEGATLPSGYTVSVGSTVPAGVTFRTFPQTVGVANYSYFRANDKTVLVDPQTRRVVTIID